MSLWKEELVNACDYIMVEKIVRMPQLLQDERYIQWCLYERWRRKRKSISKYVHLQCPLASVQQFTKPGQDTYVSPRAIDFVIFNSSKDDPCDTNAIPLVCVEVSLAKSKRESGAQFRERCLKDIFRLAYLRHHFKTGKAYFVMYVFKVPMKRKFSNLNYV